MKWKCPNCLLKNEFSSIKYYTNHMRLCTSQLHAGNIKNNSSAHSNTATNKNQVKYTHPLECLDIIEDNDESLPLLNGDQASNQLNQFHHPQLVDSPFNDHKENEEFF